MGYDFNAAFKQLNTNVEGNSANILDAEEVTAAKNNGSIWTLSEGMTAETFKEANQHCAEQDSDKDGKVTVKEQKAGIADQLKNVWTSQIARFFKDDIPYNDSNQTEAAKITQQVKNRMQNALDYINYAKNNNIDIFYNNNETGVEDKDGELQSYTATDGNISITTKKPGVATSKSNADGTYTDTYNDGRTVTWNDNGLQLSKVDKYGTQYKYTYNEDGSYTCTQENTDGSTWHIAIDKNKNEVNNGRSGYKVTAKGNYKAFALEGETVDQTLTRLGITGRAAAIVKAANPKAMKAGHFKTGDSNFADVYIPKEAIAIMKQQGIFDENRLMGVATKPSMGL